MKYYVILILSISGLFQSCNVPSHITESHKSNYIDSINNTTQIIDLLTKINTRYEGFLLNDELNFKDKECQRLADSLNVKPWAKADFDDNGLTDLLVVGNANGQTVLCILDKGESYEIRPLNPRFSKDCAFPVLENNKIKFYYEIQPIDENKDESLILEEHTLVYKFGDFIEEHENQTKKYIEKIEFSTSGCFGTCPIFDLMINFDRSATWTAKRFNKINDREAKGDYTATITQDKYTEIINLLNYIDFENLKDNYAVGWTDDQSATLTITYNNGKKKTIQDYGLAGTKGLHRLYELLFAIRENQKWVNQNIK